MFKNATKQTNKWQLKGATYLKDNAFHFVGDYIDNQIQLTFDVNGEQRLVAIPEALKSLSSQTDEIKNGVVHYNIKTFTVDHYTVLSIDNSWIQTDKTAICYCHMPYDAQGNTSILCDKLDIVGGMITKTDDCGVKVINKVLAIRLEKELLGITNTDSQDQCIAKFNAYLKINPFIVLYCLAQPVSLLLEDYSFDIQNADNTITCETQYMPSYFNVDYPMDVVINTTVDVKEVQNLAKEVRETKTLIDEIKIELDNKSDTIDQQFIKITEIEQKVDQQIIEINKMHESIANSQAQVTEALNQINTIRAEINELALEIRTICEQVSDIVDTHNTNNTAHQDIRELITDVSNQIDFDFGAF